MVTHDLRANTPDWCAHHKHTNKGWGVLLCIFLMTLRWCLQLCHHTKESGLIPALQNIIDDFLNDF